MHPHPPEPGSTNQCVGDSEVTQSNHSINLLLLSPSRLEGRILPATGRDPVVSACRTSLYSPHTALSDAPSQVSGRCLHTTPGRQLPTSTGNTVCRVHTCLWALPSEPLEPSLCPWGAHSTPVPGLTAPPPTPWQQLPGPEAFLLLAQHSGSFCSHDEAPSAQNELQEHLPPRPPWLGPLADLRLPGPAGVPSPCPPSKQGLIWL